MHAAVFRISFKIIQKRVNTELYDDSRKMEVN